MKRPNILWIMTDEQRTDSLGCYGNVQVFTPNIDALANRGTVFTDCHVQSPVCVPSRTCEISSLYPHQTGIFENSIIHDREKWPDNIVAFPQLFEHSGYITVNIGKSHLPFRSAWQTNKTFSLFKEEATHNNLGVRFDESEHKVIHRGHAERGVILSGVYPSVEGERTPQTYLADMAIDWLRQNKDSSRPFMLRVSFLAPHTPVLAPKKFYNLYDPEKMGWDIPTQEVLDTRPRYELDDGKRSAYHAHTDKEIRRMRATYYGLVSHIDEQVGRILNALKEIDKMNDTIIIFNADHGNLIGEYGQFQKSVFYDIATRIPMIIAGPGIPQGKRVTRLVEQIDLGPTLLQCAGIPVPEEMQGRNMFDENRPREEVIGEIMVQKGENILRRSWIRTQWWSLDYTSEIDERKIIQSEERDGKLIDVINDPLGHINLYYNPAYAQVVDELTHRLEQRTSVDRHAVLIAKDKIKTFE